MESCEIEGEWEAAASETELGLMVARIRFSVAGTVRVVMRFLSDSDGGVLENVGEFRLKAGWLVSDVFFKGDPVRVWMDGGDLVMRHLGDVPVRYRRIGAKEGSDSDVRKEDR